jgi:DNA-directed RNA polymerase beta subunit
MAAFTEAFRKQDGEAVHREEVLVDRDDVRDGYLALGREALVVFDPKAKGATVSDAFAQVMTWRELAEHEVTISDTRAGKESLVANPSAPHLDESGVVRVGARVRAGDVLVCKSTPAERKKSGRVDTSYRLAGERGEGEWTVVSVQSFLRGGTEPTAEEQAARDALRARYELVTRMADARGGELAGEVAQCARDEAARVGSRDLLPPGVIRFVRVVAMRQLPLVVGDTITDRRGFGAKVARVVAAAEMPKVLGQPADVILPLAKRPPASVLEARLTLAGRLLDESFTGVTDRAQVEACCERAGLPLAEVAPREGALYLLRRRERTPARRARR